MLSSFNVFQKDPMCWTNEHVRQWVQWAIKEFSLKEVNIEAFTMTGQHLCKFTREEFLRLAPAYNGDILMAHLCVLRKGRYFLTIITF